MSKTVDVFKVERKSFLNIYNDFDVWMRSLGFRNATLKESMSPMNYNYWTGGANKVDSLYSIENYIQDTLNLSIHFMRDKNKHVFYVVGGMMQISEPIELKQFKADILKQVTELKANILKELSKIPA